MPKTRQQKEETVSKLKADLANAKSVVFADYRGLTMSQLSEIRNKLRDQHATLSVTKNNLLKLAINNERSSVTNEGIFEGPIATLLTFEDEIIPIKILVKALKDAQIGKIKGGFLGDEFLDEYKVNSLANLPSKQELQGKVVGVLVAPLSGMVSVLQGNLRNLVYALDQIRISKGGD